MAALLPYWGALGSSLNVTWLHLNRQWTLPCHVSRVLGNPLIPLAAWFEQGLSGGDGRS